MFNSFIYSSFLAELSFSVAKFDVSVKNNWNISVGLDIRMSSEVEGAGIKNDVISKNVKSHKLYTELLKK